VGLHIRALSDLCTYGIHVIHDFHDIHVRHLRQKVPGYAPPSMRKFMPVM
jgi:hypothetical protein